MARPGDDEIKVVSNVARDILQSASVFKTLATVAWEYVSNSLQYIDQGIAPKVVVKINPSKKTMTIADNARGMDVAGLQNYFTMHGHNLERLSGRPGRGLFGTGKSAAFGVADRLTLSTVRNGLRNTVSVARTDIEREAAKGNVTEVPLKRIENNVATTQPNGTIISIEGIACKCDVPGVISFLQRHIGRGFKGAEVIVNGQEIECEELTYIDEKTFNTSGELRNMLGDLKLIIRVSPSPLDQDHRGIDITSSGVLLETTLGSNEGKELSNYIFGELEVPQLMDQASGPNPAFNLTRDMRLNSENRLVQAVHTFISLNVDEVRRQLVEEANKRKQTEEAKRLQKQADEIAKLLNADFDEYSDKIQRIRATVSTVGVDRAEDEALGVGKDTSATIFGGDEDAEVVAASGGLGGDPNGNGGGPGGSQREQNPIVESKEDGDPLGLSVGAARRKKPTRAGFRVEYLHLGEEDYRAKYDRDSRTIVINLDFPQIAQALERDGIESTTFQHLSNEVAITEYAIAISSELVNSAIYNDPSDYIFEIRRAVNRINRRAANRVVLI